MSKRILYLPKPTTGTDFRTLNPYNNTTPCVTPPTTPRQPASMLTYRKVIMPAPLIKPGGLTLVNCWDIMLNRFRRPSEPRTFVAGSVDRTTPANQPVPLERGDQ
jgi:hypothetical protein